MHTIPLMLTFSPERLAEARVAAGISREVAAVTAEVSFTTVRNAESGRNTPGAEVLATWAALYGVPLESLFVHEPEAATASTASGKPHEPDTAVVEGSAGLARSGA